MVRATKTFQKKKSLNSSYQILGHQTLNYKAIKKQLLKKEVIK